MDDQNDGPPDQFDWYAPRRWSRVDLIVGAVCCVIGLITLFVIFVLMLEWMSGNAIFSCVLANLSIRIVKP